MRIKKNINLGIINWSNAKFSELTYCIVNSKKNYKFDLGVKGLRDSKGFWAIQFTWKHFVSFWAVLQDATFMVTMASGRQFWLLN